MPFNNGNHSIDHKTALKEMNIFINSKEKIMVGADYGIVNLNGKSAQFGMGVYGGFIEDTKNQNFQCFKNVSFLQAFFHKVAGYNLVLGPTAEYSPNKKGTIFADKKELIKRNNQILNDLKLFGIKATIKHLPYTPETFNNHEQLIEDEISIEEIEEKLSFYREIEKTDYAMTTHVFHSSVDGRNISTFSKDWIEKIKSNIDPETILMTDAVGMINSYNKINQANDYSFCLNSIDRERVKESDYYKRMREDAAQSARFTILSFLAGHDLVMLEGNAWQTKLTLKGTLEFACSSVEGSEKLIERIDDSYKKIKKSQSKIQSIYSFPDELVEKAINIFDHHIVYLDKQRTMFKDAPYSDRKICNPKKQSEFDKLKYDIIEFIGKKNN